jgi:hypothetical protein
MTGRAWFGGENTKLPSANVWFLWGPRFIWPRLTDSSLASLRFALDVARTAIYILARGAYYNVIVGHE